MKRLVLAAAATLALAGAASAMTSATDSLQAEVNGYVRGIDLGTLTEAQIGAIRTVIHSGSSPAEVRAFIQSVVSG